MKYTTAAAAARQAGVSAVAWRAYERGGHAAKLDTARRIARVLHLHTADVLRAAEEAR